MGHWKSTETSCYQQGTHQLTSSSFGLTTSVGRYHDGADEPDSTDRLIVFTVSDGTFDGVSSLTLNVVTVDDNPTRPVVSGSGSYDYNEGGSPTVLAGIMLTDEDSSNSNVTVDSVTIEVVDGAENEVLDMSSTSPDINV